MFEKTLLIIKPDTFSKKLVGKIISKFEDNGLHIMAAEMVWMDSSRAEEFYVEHRDKEFYRELVEFISSNPVMVIVFGGEDAIKFVRELVGATDPLEAEDGTIRKEWAYSKRYNIIHASDSVESACREISMFFPESKIYDWKEKEYKDLRLKPRSLKRSV